MHYDAYCKFDHMWLFKINNQIVFNLHAACILNYCMLPFYKGLQWY